MECLEINTKIAMQHNHCQREFHSPAIQKPGFKGKTESPTQIIHSKINTYPNLSILNPERDNLNPVFEITDKLYEEEMSPTEICLIRHTILNDYFILKKINKNKLLAPEHWNSALLELKIHSQLSHPNIIDNINSGESDSAFLELLEYAPRFNYFVEKIEINNMPFMTKRDGGIRKLKSFCFDILQGLKFLHSVNVIHMDIKPANLLLSTKVSDDEYCIVKICDFGLSKIANSNGEFLLRSRCGSEPYIAPEVVSGNIVTSAVDIWSFGIFLYILTVGYSPMTLKWRPGMSLPAYARHWKKYEDTGLFSFIEQCLQLEPARRITAQEALRHQWLASI